MYVLAHLLLRTPCECVCVHRRKIIKQINKMQILFKSNFKLSQIHSLILNSLFEIIFNLDQFQKKLIKHLNSQPQRDVESNTKRKTAAQTSSWSSYPAAVVVTNQYWTHKKLCILVQFNSCKMVQGTCCCCCFSSI